MDAAWVPHAPCRISCWFLVACKLILSPLFSVMINWRQIRGYKIYRHGEASLAGFTFTHVHHLSVKANSEFSIYLVIQQSGSLQSCHSVIWEKWWQALLGCNGTILVATSGVFRLKCYRHVTQKFCDCPGSAIATLNGIPILSQYNVGTYGCIA